VCHEPSPPPRATLARSDPAISRQKAICVPEGTYGRIAPRSGLAWKSHIDVGAGVIDEDYTGNVGVVLFNHAEEDLVGVPLSFGLGSRLLPACTPSVPNSFAAPAWQ